MAPTYEQMPEQVEAHQVELDNGEFLEEWCGGVLVEEIHPMDENIKAPGINVPTEDGNKRASFMDFIVKFPNGRFEVWKPEAFQAAYRTPRA